MAKGLDAEGLMKRALAAQGSASKGSASEGSAAKALAGEGSDGESQSAREPRSEAEPSGDSFDPFQSAVLESRLAFCVTAGAGSGKTRTLVEYLLRFVEADPERNSLTKALVMTFSEKAAAELRDRVAAELGARLRLSARNGDSERRALWERELRRLGQSQISTIHAYALGLVTDRSHLLGMTSDLAVDPESQASDLREIVDDLLDEQNSDLLSLISIFPLSPHPWASFQTVSVIGLLSKLLSRQSAWGLESLRSAIEGPPAPGELAAALAGLKRASREALEFVESDPRWAKNNLNFTEMAREVSEILKASDRELAKKLPETLKTLHGKIANGKFGRQLGNVGRAHKEALQEALGAVWEWRSNFEAEPVAGAVARLANLVFLRIREKRLRRGRVTFDDILAMARDLLKSRPSVRAEEARRWRLVMVDEFQDTNRLQTDLLAQLLADPDGPACEWDDLKWASLEPKLKVVGDPKQSIYRFRGSEPNIMALLSKNLGEGGGDSLPLSVNYRTQKPLVEFLNSFFEVLLKDPLKDAPKDALKAQAYYQPQEFKRPAHYPETVPVVWLKGASKSPAGLPAPRQARAIVSYLRDLFSGEAGVLVADKGPGGAEGPPRLPVPGDVALLLRRKKNALVYQEALTKAGFPCHTLKGRDWFEAPEIRGLAAAYLFLAGREPDYNLALALASPFGPVSEETLLALAWPQAPKSQRKRLSSYFSSMGLPWPDSIHPDDKTVLEEIRDLFLSLGPLVPKLHAGDAIEALIEARRLLPLVIGGPGGSSERVKDVQSFLAAVKALPETDSLRGGGQADLIEIMRESGAAAKDDDSAGSEEDPESGSVNIMTVHASKGLEFPIVVIPEADFKLPSGDRNLVISDDGQVALSFQSPESGLHGKPTKFAELSAAESDFSLEESRRVLYVACTRARDHLVLVGKSFATSTSERWLKSIAESSAFEKYGRTIEFSSEDLEEPAQEAEGPEAGEQEAGGPEGLSQAGPSSGAPVSAENEEDWDYDPALIGPFRGPRIWTLSATRYCAIMDHVHKRPEWRERVLAGEFPSLEGSWEPSEAGEEDGPAPTGRAAVGPSGPTSASDRGTLFHAVLEATDYAWTEAAYLDELSRRAKAKGLKPSSEELVFLASRALMFQESELGRQAAEALNEGRLIKREWPFWLRLDSDELGDGTIRLSGVIDLFFVDSEGKGRIVDYKLSISRNLHRGAYKRQLEVYSKAIRQAGFAGADRLTAELWYSEP